MAVTVHKAHRRFDPLAMRLVIIPKPPDAAAKATRKAARASRKAQRRRTDPRTTACAEHLLLLTSLPAELAEAAQLGALYGLRWQIELVFKRLKSLLHIDRLPAKDPDLVRTWLLAHLLVALMAEHHLAQDQPFFPSG